MEVHEKRKLLEAFEDCYKTSRDYKFYVKHEMSEKQIFEFKNDKYVVDCVNDGWKIWQAAKAHEAEKLKGCVLVPVQCPDPDFADSLFDELSKKAIGEFGDDLLIHFSDIDEEKIWALMVEAAKAQAAPEGFVLVSKTPSLKVLDRLYAEHDIDEERAAYIYRDIINEQEPAND